MKFEVDNTTEKIANELQEAMDESIRDIHDNQSNIIRMVDALDKKISTENIEKSIKDVGKNIVDLSDSVDNIERSCEDSSSMIDGLKTKIDRILEYCEKNDLEGINSSLQDANRILKVIDSKEDNTISEIKTIALSISNTLHELNAVRTALESIDVKLKDINDIEESTNAAIHSNELLMKELKKTIEDIDAASKYQAEKTEELCKYLQRPGISRLFKGMGKDNDNGNSK